MTHPVMHAAINSAEAYDGGKGIPSLAKDLELPYITLYQQLHSTGSAKLGLLTALRIINRTKDPRILHAMEEAAGYLPSIPRPDTLDVCGDEAMAHVARTMKEVADVTQAICARIHDGISDNDMEVIQREWSEAMQAGVAMMAHLEGMRTSRKPAHLREVRAA